MFNDSELRRIEDSLKHHREEQTKLISDEKEIRERSRRAQQRIQTEEERDLLRLQQKYRNLEREIARLDSDRKHRQNELQEQLNKSVKH